MRVLVIAAEPFAAEAIRDRCAGLLSDGHEVAICCALSPELGLRASLDVQRRITLSLRQALAHAAEAIPVFIVTGTAGDGIEDCARAWGATDVKP